MIVASRMPALVFFYARPVCVTINQDVAHLFILVANGPALYLIAIRVLVHYVQVHALRAGPRPHPIAILFGRRDVVAGRKDFRQSLYLRIKLRRAKAPVRVVAVHQSLGLVDPVVRVPVMEKSPPVPRFVAKPATAAPAARR